MSEKDPLDLCEDSIHRGAALRFADKSGLKFQSFTEALKWGLGAIMAVTFSAFIVSAMNR